MESQHAGDPGVEHVTKSSLDFPVVGIGASAGGINAVLAFLEGLPRDPGMAFVIVLHLSATHESNAADIFQRATAMPVRQVMEDGPLEIDHVYVIAPGRHLTMDDGLLRVSPREQVGGAPIAIDRFFRTLAKAHGERAVAIVLSGSGADGSVGLAELKLEGGMVFAQLPSDAEHEAMPVAAIATRLVDFVMPAPEIPAKLISLWANARKIELLDPQAIGAQIEEPSGAEAKALAEAALRDVMLQLKERTGNDFQHYKRATVLRRLERRMQVTGQPTLPDYRDYLDRHPPETALLLQDMLISVTSFFRDRAAFDSLERELARLFHRRSAPSQFRAWSVGCATGEEAYSLAMLIQDHLPSESPPSVQVFGTDVDDRALLTARLGLYPEAIVADVPPMRMRQHFLVEAGGCRVRKSLRELVMFATHNILRDPPFSRLDLVSCRNLLIYLEREVQAEVLELLHFALNPGGLLFLGSADSAEAVPELFSPVDKKNRIYRAEVVTRARLDLPFLRSHSTSAAVVAKAVASVPRELGALHERLLAEALPPCVLINAQRSVLRIDGGASRFLRVPEGEPVNDLLEIIRPELAPALRIAVLHALHTGTRVLSEVVRLKAALDAAPVYLRMAVLPASGADQANLFVVRFDEVEADLSALAPAPEEGRPAAIDVLEQELRRLATQLQGSFSDSVSSTEALRASNEELQSMNEELRSATEELETSKEELQSVNEELSTVNLELNREVEEAGKVNDDLHNLIVSMDMATVFVDATTSIKRFTPRAAEVFNLKAGDLGRSLFDLTHRLDYEPMHDDVTRVLTHLQIVEREVRSQGGQWFLVRISPYRRGETRVDGAVINLIDISQRRQAEEQVRARDARLRLVAESTRDYAILTTDTAGRITSWNNGAESMFGYTEAEIVGEHFRRLFVREDRDSGQPEEELRTALEIGRALDERWHERKDGSRFYCSGITTRFSDGEHQGFAKIARDLTDRQQIEKQREILLEGERELRGQLEAAAALRSEFLAIMSHELKNPLNLILLNAEVISRSLVTKASPALSRAADIIQRTVRSQSQIIDDLLDLSRLTTGKFALKPTAVSYLQIVEGIVGAAADDARIRDVALSLKGIDVAVYADPIRLEQIVWNLLSNALKFTSPGGRVDVELRQDGSWAVLTVKDDGRGIEPALLDRIFDMFEQGQRASTTRRDGGLGIGLSLVKQLVELQGGSVTSFSEGLGKGATFTVTLPVSEPAPQARENGGARRLKGLRTLIVDDDSDALAVMGMLLESEGCHPVLASSGEEALRHAADADFDLVLSDIGMPGMDGYELIRQLRARSRSRAWPAIAITGFSRAADAGLALAAGFDVHLPKPVSLDAINRAWQSMHRRKPD